MKAIYKIIIILVALVLAVNVTAQERKDRRFRTDIRFGLNFTDFDIKENNDDQNLKIGANVGLFMSYKIHGDFQVQTGFIATKKGMKKEEYTVVVDPITDVSEVTDRKTSIDAGYMQIPFNIGWEHFFNNDLAININAGPWVAYGFKGDQYIAGEITYKGGTPQNPVSLDTGRTRTFRKGEYSKWDYGYGVSVGMIYDIYAITLGADLGQKNIRENILTGNVKTRSFYISAGFRF